MRRSASHRSRRISITEQHVVLLPIRETGNGGGGIHLRASTASADGPSLPAGDLPLLFLDERCRLAARGRGQARLHRLGRSCALSADHAVVVLDGDVLEQGERQWRVRFEATWRVWREDGSTEARGASWPAAVALAACLGFAPMANAQTATGRDQRPTTSQSAARLPSAPRQTSQTPTASSTAEASDEGAQNRSSSPLGRLVVEALAAQPGDGICRARLVSADGSIDQKQSSSGREFVFTGLPAGEYHVTVAQDGVPDAPTAGIDLEVAPGATTEAEVTLGPPLASEPIGEDMMGIIRPIPPADVRPFGHRSRPYDDGPAYEDSHDDDDRVRGKRIWPSSLVRRPLSPWQGLFEGRALGEIDLGANHAGRPIRFAPSFAYGIAQHWGIAVDTRRGLCANSGDDRCDRRLDQLSADVVYLLDSFPRFEWLVRAGLATGPFDPFALSLRAGGAAKALVLDRVAIQVEVLAQVPINQRDRVPTILQLPAQLQLQLASHVATYLSTGLRGAFLSGERQLTVPAGAGLLVGWHAFDLGVEWRFPRVLGTNRTWDERSVLAIIAIRLD